MGDQRLDRMERLFRAALMHPPDEREVFLDAAVPDDPELRQEVLSLLDADLEAEQSEFLDKPITSLSGLGAVLDSVDRRSIERPIDREVGPYRIQRFIGHGGMGDVYLAVRDIPFRQHVALKIIRRGMDSDEVTRRFEMERQILASLNHPNIGRLYDGGMTEDRLPYFAMEYVDGVPITEYCDSRSLSLDDRLQLFQYVCRAVHHAHRNLVIHRDIKPSNILVTGEGLPKLLDFGIAKLLNPNLGPIEAPVTRTEIRAMTPEYASPEQARGDSLTTASDIYSLGIILYELLAGRRPYYFKRKTSEEILSILYDYEPERPSSVVLPVSQVNERKRGPSSYSPSETGERRGLSPERLHRRLKGDLDNIVLMALRKEPERRYASAEQFAGDIDRYLAGNPVIAHRDSPGYRLRKYVQRHRVQTVATLIILLLLITGSALTIYQAGQVARERDRARLEADRSEQVTSFLVSLLAAADPSFSLGESVTVRELLDRGAERIDSELSDQPSIQATLLDVIGTAYLNLGEYELADKTLEKALNLRRKFRGELDQLAETLYGLGFANEVLGRFGKADQFFRESLEIQGRLGSKSRPSYLVGLFHLGTVTHFRGDIERADSLYDEWERLYRQVSDRNDPKLAEATFGMARVSYARKQHRIAEEYAATALELNIRKHGPLHPNVASTLMILGSIQVALGDLQEAEETALRALAMLHQLYPDGHRDVATTVELLGSVYNAQGRIAEAEEQFLRGVDLWATSDYADSLSLALAKSRAGRFYLQNNRHPRAARFLRDAESVARSVLSENNPVVVRMRLSLTEALIALGQKKEARSILERDLTLLLRERDSEDSMIREARKLLTTLD